MAKNPQPKKKWTFMVYLAGDNNLEENGVTDLGEMKQVGSNNDLNIIAQFDCAAEGIDTRRYYLRKGTSLNSDAVMDLSETNTGDPQALMDFIRWGITNYPADRYAVVLWNHGQGWDDTDIYRAVRRDLKMAVSRRGRVITKPKGRPAATIPSGRLRRAAEKPLRHAFFNTSTLMGLSAAARGGHVARAILLDDNAKDFLDNLEMKKAMVAVKRKLKRKIDLLGMDACLMNMAEVAYQIRQSVDYTVGSEETEPLDGWPYHTALASLAQNPSMTPAQLADLLVTKYLASYPSSEAVTQSALDLSRSAPLATAVKTLASALRAGLSNQSTRLGIMQARNQVQSYAVEDNVDLADLCTLLEQQQLSAPITSACQAVRAATSDAGGIVRKFGYKNSAMANSHGLAIYFPTREVSPLYARLDFSKKTSWGSFLESYVGATRRRG